MVSGPQRTKIKSKWPCNRGMGPISPADSHSNVNKIRPSQEQQAVQDWKALCHRITSAQLEDEEASPLHPISYHTLGFE